LPIASLLGLIGFSLTIYGWGRAVNRILNGDRKVAHAYATGLGIVVLTFVGGLLNALGLATASVLAVIAYLGVAFGAIFVATSLYKWQKKPFLSRANLPNFVFLAFAGVIILFLAEELLPTRVFNHHDDFLTYLPRIVRMRETGSVAGNPYDLLGLAGFGADAFFQALGMTWLPLTSVTAFDAIFCFVLSLLLLAEFGRQHNTSWIFIGLAWIFFIVINPMIVNLSTVYSTSALLLTLVLSTSIMLSESDSANRFRSAIPVATSLAALVAFKNTAIFFAIPFLAIIASGMLVRNMRAAVVAMLAIVVYGLTAILPWLIVSSDHLLRLLHERSISIPVDPARVVPYSFAEAFRNQPTLYGSTRIDFAFAIVSVMLLILIGLYQALQRRGNWQSWLWLAAGIGCLCVYVGAAGYVNNEASLRYSVPFLLTIAALTTLAIPAPAEPTFSKSYIALLAAVSITQTASMVIFAKSFFQRIVRVATEHTEISYSTTPEYREWQTSILGEEGRARIRTIQDMIPAKTRIFAWVEAPFHMDFARNDIVQFNRDFFVAPWRLDTTNYDTVRNEFEMYKISSVLVEFGSQSVVPEITQEQLQSKLWPEYRIGIDSMLKLLGILQQISKQNRTLLPAKGIALIRLDGKE